MKDMIAAMTGNHEEKCYFLLIKLNFNT